MTDKKQEVSFIDAEFDSISSEKVDYPMVLVQQLNYIRYLMSQDMGLMHIFELSYTDRTKEPIWFENLSKFINSVETLQSSLLPYQDSEGKFKEDVKKEFQLYNNAKSKAMKKCNEIKDSKKRQEKLLKTKLEFNLLKKRELYRHVYEHCLALMSKASLIGGNDQMEDFM